MREQESLNTRLEAELKAKDAHLAEVEKQLAQEIRKRKESEESLVKLHKELESLTD